jgi:site-specific DNA-methyltransferase (adenine-specific)
MKELKNYKLNPENPRQIQKEKFEKLCKSLKEFPVMLKYRPIVVDKYNMILGGNMRFRALQANGETEVPDEYIVCADDLTPEQYNEFIIKDNIEFGGMDWDKIANDWDAQQLLEWGLDISEMSLNKDVEEDEAPLLEETEEPKSKLGEIYQLGKHRLMCGDATNLDNVKLLMADATADLLHTDPPYNVDYTGKTKDALKIENDKKDDETFKQFLIDAFVNASVVMKDGGAFYIYHADSEGYNFRGGGATCRL